MKIGEIVSWLNDQNKRYVFKGSEEQDIHGFASLSNYKAGCITWIKKQESYNAEGRPEDIALAVIQSGVEVNIKNVITTDNSKELFFDILNHFWGSESIQGHIGDGTFVSENANIDPTATIGCNCSIVGDVFIGAHTVIEHNVVIQGNVRIGSDCHIQSGSVIGIDGFGYTQDSITKKKTMVEHFGSVIIGDDVFIGSHVNIARGTIDDTVIEDGVKIAPSTHIGHNNHVGENATIICSNLYGSVCTGAGAYVTASTIENQLRIGENTVVGMGSVVTKSIESNVIAYGIPAKVMKTNDSGL